MTTPTVMQRHEKKYLLSASQYTALQEALAEWMQVDQYGQHTICSLYFDTRDFACARRQMEKNDYREKMRIRSYGVPDAQDSVYLELKKKYDGITYKRRIGLPYQDVWNYVRYGEAPLEKNQIFKEVDCFFRKEHLVPKAMICYDRIALYSPWETGLRITFDSRIRWREEELDLSRGDWGAPLLAPGEVLMEIKAPGALPFWLSRTLSQHKIFPTSFSKYKNVYFNLMEEREVTACAG